jgi:hypothetical protein
VAMGYTCHPLAEWDAPYRRVPFTRMVPLDGLTEG